MLWFFPFGTEQPWLTDPSLAYSSAQRQGSKLQALWRARFQNNLLDARMVNNAYVTLGKPTAWNNGRNASEMIRYRSLVKIHLGLFGEDMFVLLFVWRNMIGIVSRNRMGFSVRGQGSSVNECWNLRATRLYCRHTELNKQTPLSQSNQFLMLLLTPALSEFVSM